MIEAKYPAAKLAGHGICNGIFASAHRWLCCQGKRKDEFCANPFRADDIDIFIMCRNNIFHYW